MDKHLYNSRSLNAFLKNVFGIELVWKPSFEDEEPPF